VIAEVYDSWYALFGRTRQLIADIPAHLLPLNLVPWPRDHVPLWGSLPSCAPIANRRARRLATAAQDDILPHGMEPFLSVAALAP
jgi:hypothetical protein